MQTKITKQVEVNDGQLTLTVQAVNQAFLRQLLLEMGDPEKLIAGGLKTIQLDAKVTAVQGAHNYLNYCLAMGVVDDPPDDLEQNELSLFMSNEAKKSLENPNIRRSNWLRFFINDGTGLSMSDQSRLVAEITALTFGTAIDEPDKPAPKKVKTKKAKRAYTT